MVVWRIFSLEAWFSLALWLSCIRLTLCARLHTDGISEKDSSKEPQPCRKFGSSESIKASTGALPKEHFRCQGRVFRYYGEFDREMQGQQSHVAHVVEPGEGIGSMFIMKRPRYQDNLWDDNLEKECFVLRYLKSKGVKNVPECVAECELTADDVCDIQEMPGPPYRKPEFERGSDKSGAVPKWHVIIMSLVSGRSFLHGNFKLNNDDMERTATANLVDTLWSILRAGIVNGDQYHNILFDARNGDANFIDFEGSHFLNDAPLRELEALMGRARQLQHKKSIFTDPGPNPYKVVEQPPDEVLACKTFDTRITNKRTISADIVLGIPELFVDGAFRPICGHCFWNNDNGAKTFCKQVGYDSGSVVKLSETYEVETAFVSACSANASLESCSGCWSAPSGSLGSDAASSVLFVGGSCAPGRAPKVEVECKGQQKFGVDEICEDLTHLAVMVGSIFRLIPPHAKEVAAEAIKRQAPLVDSRLDNVVSEAWKRREKELS